MNSVKKYTPESFKKHLLTNHPLFKNQTYELISDYIRIDTKVLIKTPYGICAIEPRHLLKNVNLTIRAAIDKTEYFKNLLFTKNNKYRNGSFKIVSKYKTSDTYIVLKDRYGYWPEVSYDIVVNGILDERRESALIRLNS